MTVSFRTDELVMPSPRPAEVRKNNFDLLRLVAAILVVISHVEYPYFDHKVDWLGLISYHFSGGALGVSIFFVISGYLVPQSRWRSSLADYSINRFLRIVPGLAACVLFLVVVIWPVSGLSLPDYLFTKMAGSFLLNILIFPINTCVAPIASGFLYDCNLMGATWTLTYEVMMYVFVGLIGFLKPRNQIAAMTIVLTAILVLIARDLLYPLGEWRIDFAGIHLFLFIPHMGLPFIGLFLMGSLLNFVPRQILQNWLTGIVAALIFVGTFRTNVPLFLFVHILTIPPIVLCLGLHRWRVADVYAKVGDLSYGIFLYHFPVITLTWIYLHDRVSSYSMSLVLACVTTALAYASYHLIEHPALQLKRRRVPSLNVTSLQ